MFGTLKQSFTLVEISIVLMILSILTAAVLSANSIIKSAKSQKIIQEISTYRQAINSFYQMYNALPGDYNNAQYDLTPSSCNLTNCNSVAESSIATLDSSIRSQIPLNGNGDGKVDYTIGGSAILYKSEAFGVWSHLSAQNLIPYKYSNTCKNTASNTRKECLQADYNLPRISGGFNTSSVYIFHNSSEYNEDIYGQIFDKNYNPTFVENAHVLSLVDISHSYAYGSSSNIGNYVHGGGGGVSSDLMVRIDSKIDDGRPLTGNVYGINGSNEDNAISQTSKTGQCNNYKGANSSFMTQNNLTRDKVVYSNDNNQACIGVIVFDEFAS